VSGQSDKDDRHDAMAAIRDAVEANRETLAGIDAAGILDLDDIVWRSPARSVVDSTDIIMRLAEEAEKLGRGLDDPPPRAAVVRSRAEPDFGTRPSAASTPYTPGSTEERIRLLVTASLEAEGRIGADGKIDVSEEELRKLVRAQINTFLAQNRTGDQHETGPDIGQDGLRDAPEMRTTSARSSGKNRD